MDGGFGTALGAESQKEALWGAQLLFSSNGHKKIESVHTAFLDAGADLISTNSYQVSFECFSMAGTFNKLPGGAITQEKHQLRYTKDCLRTAVELARKCSFEHLKARPMGAEAPRPKPLVAASLGPAGDNLKLWTGATDKKTSVFDTPDDAVFEYYHRKVWLPRFRTLSIFPRVAHLRSAALSYTTDWIARPSQARPRPPRDVT